MLATTPGSATAPFTGATQPGLTSATGSCGVERWYVKTGMDPDAAQVVPAPKDTTIAQLAAQPTPSDLPGRFRSGTVERTVWRLHVTLTQYRLEDDSDVHLVLADGQGHTMITEVPDVACIGLPSPFKEQIRAVRSQLDARFPTRPRYQPLSLAVTITGVGFFDVVHGQSGVASNGIELHPVLSLEFASAGPPAPPSAAATTAAGPGRCDPAYPDFCIPPPPPDLDCASLNPRRYPGAHGDFTAPPPDPHHLDGNGDGRGCVGGIG